jgi:hypothetical protein
MIKNFVRALPVLCLAAAALPAAAQSASGAGSITVIRPLTVTKNTDMTFGTVVRPASGTGSIAVSAAASATRTAADGAVALASTSHSAAKFTIDGEGGQMLTVTIPATFTMNNNTTSGSLTVTTSHDLGTLTSVQLSNALGAAGTKEFYVGGSIPIAADTASGAYSGTFTVSASYN